MLSIYRDTATLLLPNNTSLAAGLSLRQIVYLELVLFFASLMSGFPALDFREWARPRWYCCRPRRAAAAGVVHRQTAFGCRPT
jgi:hypothetical protein